MKYFKQEDFDKCMRFLVGKPDTVETQQELYKFMHEECNMLFAWNSISVKNMTVYARVYKTRLVPRNANWCCTMSDGSQVVWNRKYQEFYWIDEVGIDRCGYLNCLSMFVELDNVDNWLLENWSNWQFVETQKQLIAIWNGKYYQHYRNVWR